MTLREYLTSLMPNLILLGLIVMVIGSDPMAWMMGWT